jgi:hypothetical protein
VCLRNYGVAVPDESPLQTTNDIVTVALECMGEANGGHQYFRPGGLTA